MCRVESIIDIGCLFFIVRIIFGCLFRFALKQRTDFDLIFYCYGCCDELGELNYDQEMYFDSVAKCLCSIAAFLTSFRISIESNARLSIDLTQKKIENMDKLWKKIYVFREVFCGIQLLHWIYTQKNKKMVLLKFILKVFPTSFL